MRYFLERVTAEHEVVYLESFYVPYSLINSRIASCGGSETLAKGVSSEPFGSCRRSSKSIFAFGCAVTGTTKLTRQICGWSALGCVLAYLKASAAARFPPAEAPHSAIRLMSTVYLAAF